MFLDQAARIYIFNYFNSYRVYVFPHNPEIKDFSHSSKLYGFIELGAVG
jgi:hypothetical protein